MKRIFISFVLVVMFSSLYATDYYFYNGKKIPLQGRNDRVVVVANQSNIQNARNLIVSNLNAGDRIKASFKNIFLIELRENNFSSVSNYINRFSYKKDLIKFTSPCYYGDSRKVCQILTDEFIVRLRTLSDKIILEQICKKQNIEIIGRCGDEYTFVLKSNDGVNEDVLELSEIFRQTGAFEYCEPNFLIPAEGLFLWSPNDQFYPSQWALNNTGQVTATEGDPVYGDLNTSGGIPGADIQVWKAWDFVKGNNSVLVADFDIGVDSLHPDLAGNLVTGYNAFYNNNTVTTDAWGHGTCTMGIFGAISNNSIGIAGIAGGSGTQGSACKFSSYKLCDDTGNFVQTNFIARAFDTARARNVFVINNSWGGITPSSTLDSSISRCARLSRGGLGCVILFAAGNDGANPPIYPSYLPFVVSVGASTRHDQQKCFGTGNQFFLASNYGEDITKGDLDVVAPTICYTTDIRGPGGLTTTDYYETFSGTSAATANATGVTALIFSVNPGLTAAQVKDYLFRGCDKIENVPYSFTKTYGKWSTLCGYGRVNAYNSVRLAAGVDVTPPTINHTNVNSHSSTYPTLVNAEILDQNGGAIPITGTNQQKVFYRMNKNSAGWSGFDSLIASTNAENNFTFKIPCIGWQTEVQYYFRARDNTGNECTFPLHANISNPYTLCYFATGTQVTDSVSITGWIFDNNYSTSPNIYFSNNYKILNTRARINLAHGRMIDYVFLIMWSPNTDNNNNRKSLYGYNYQTDGLTPGGGINNAMISDGGTTFWKDGTMPWTNGNMKADYTLKGYSGTNEQGYWRFIGFDWQSGEPATFNNATVYVTRLSGTVSSAARLNTAGDSVLNFGIWNGVPDTMNFYLKNVGNASLTVGTVNFTGLNPQQYSLVNTPPASIAVNDSGLFKVRFNHNALEKSNRKNLRDAIVENGILNINTNDPSKPVFKVSLQYNDTLVIVKENNNNIPDRFALYQNYPNPFNAVTKIRFDVSGHPPYLPSKGEVVTLKIFDIIGREIQTLVNEQLQPGTYEVMFDGSNLASGIYFYQLKSENFSETKKLIITK